MSNSFPFSYQRIAFRLFALLTLAVAVESCAVNPVTGKKEVMLMSEEAEVQMGRESDPQIVASFGLYEDPALQNMIDHYGQRMAEISHRPNLKYDFKILDSPVVNAFAVPGGYVYFTRGILAHFNNKAEFIGVLGHEIGHITARHSAKQATNNVLFQAGLITGMVISPEFARFSEMTQQALGLLFLQFSRSNESQSDELGVLYSTQIGYDAKEMANFFRTIGRLQGGAGSLPDFLSTHPNPDDRYATVGRLAAEMQEQSDLSSFIVGREEYLDLIDGLIYGEDPRKGFVDDNTFFHPDLRFSFRVPDAWSVTNSPTSVLVANEEGDALIVFSIAQAENLSAAAAKTIEELNLNVQEQRALQLNGFPAYRVVATQTDPQDPTRVFAFRMVFYQDGDLIYRSLAVSTSASAGQRMPVMQPTINGFKRLTDPARLNVQPERIKIVSVPRDGRADEILRELGVSQEDLEELAVVNGVELNDGFKAGQRIKLISRG